MCGIFGILSKSNNINISDFYKIALQSERRGSDSSGLLHDNDNDIFVSKSVCGIKKHLKYIESNHLKKSKLICGHTRLITNGNDDNQPVIRDNIIVIHNGIIINHENLFEKYSSYNRKYEIDSEVLNVLALHEKANNGSIENIGLLIEKEVEGTVSTFIIDIDSGDVVLYSNVGSLYYTNDNDSLIFASELAFLSSYNNVKNLKGSLNFKLNKFENIHERITNPPKTNQKKYVIPVCSSQSFDSVVRYEKINLKRCSKCILPESMPFIYFDKNGVCNYCHNHRPIDSRIRPIEELIGKVAHYKSPQARVDCVIPFSGGRDSTFMLDYVVNELKLKPVTMTYDWGVVTDLARRNVSRVTSRLGVENIIIAADIEKKRKNINMNLNAWLKKPHLGMLNLLMAGDKHFFKYIENVKDEFNCQLNLWGMNPYELTHFKAGFLGIEPMFNTKQVFYTGMKSQIEYQSKRFKQIIKNPNYLNSSLFDTLSGEYYRSIKSKVGFYNLFDFVEWNQDSVEDVLKTYDWEWSTDGVSSWRIGDGTAAFYNYVYYSCCGFTENDTFRSNQIRENKISREKALFLVEKENAPKNESMNWYLNTVGVDAVEAIKVVNRFAEQYRSDI